jgi:signal transduction histidine kinase
MLSEFVKIHREEIIARCRTRVAERMAPRPTRSELELGIPLFLRELGHTLECELGHRPGAAPAAVQHGRDLLRSGFTIVQVVHGYGDACQAITELAIERNAPISTEEFRALNKCLDGAIATAVTEYKRQHELDVAAEGARRSNEHLGSFAHELHNLLGSAMLAFDVLRVGSVGIQGRTGDALGHSLVGLRDLVDRSLTEVRLTAGIARQEHITVARFIEDIEVSAVLSAHASGLRLTVTQVDPKLTVEADRQILSSVVSNLLQNAFKHTRPYTHVRLHTHATAERVLFEIEDQCGGIPPGKLEHLLEPCEPQSGDRTGLGPGLAICVRGVNALRGAIRVRNQNKGCVFTVDLPRALPSIRSGSVTKYADR